MARALTPISVIASDICGDLGDSTGRYKFSILRKLMAGWRELNYFIDQSFCVKTAVLTVDNVVSMPDDFIYETKVGLRRNGVTAVLTLDSSIERKSISQEETEAQLNAIWNGEWKDELAYPFYNYAYNGSLGEIYGYGGVVNVNGYYNINRGTGEIYIGSLVPDDAELVIEYKSSGDEDGFTLVPTEYWACLKNYALSEWFMVKEPSKGQMFRAYYEREYNKVKRLKNWRSALFIANTMAEHYRASVH